MLLSKSLERIIRLLLTSGMSEGSLGSGASESSGSSGVHGEPVASGKAKRRYTLRELAGEAGVNLARASVDVNKLASAGYVEKTRSGLEVRRKEDLLMAFSCCWSFSEVPRIGFESLDRPALLIKKIAEIGGKKKLEYAFSSLAGAELLAPMVVPTSVHLYIKESEADAWKDELKKSEIYSAEKNGKIELLLWDDAVFYGKLKVRDTNVVCIPQLFADLYSSGGIYRDAALHLKEKADV